MRTLAIVQARTGSSRLPGKVLADIEGRPMLWYVVHRLQQSKLVDEVVVATPWSEEDLAIHALCESWGVRCFAAATDNDVLSRYMEVAAACGAPDWVVRVTADCPLIDPALVDLGLAAIGNDDQLEYCSNVHPDRHFPDGLDFEVLSWDLLTWLFNTARGADREHVTSLYRRGEDDPLPASFRYVFAPDLDLASLRWTVDTAEDLAFVREVFHRLAPRWDFGWREVLALGTFAHRRVA
jgi:spore coat polysaccharide biosynthesis protein SpsF (cytidylyltransferase family)